MKHIRITIILGLGFLFAAKAQFVEDRKNKIGIQAGFLQTYHKDVNFSPLNNTGNGYSFGLNYERSTQKKHLIFSTIHYSESVLTSRASEFFRYDRYLLNFEIGFLFHKPLPNKNLILNIGGSFQSRTDLIDYKDFKSVSFFNYHGLALNSRLEYTINPKHSLGSALSVPVLGVLVRPPYTGWDKYMIENEDNFTKVLYKGKTTSLNDFFGYNWHVFYNYQLSKRIGIQLQYELRYHKTKQPRKAIIANHQTSVELNFKF